MKQVPHFASSIRRIIALKDAELSILPLEFAESTTRCQPARRAAWKWEFLQRGHLNQCMLIRLLTSGPKFAYAERVF
jgi:hypothetical protein